MASKKMLLISCGLLLLSSNVYSKLTDGVDLPLYALPDGLSDMLSLSLVDYSTVYNFTYSDRNSRALLTCGLANGAANAANDRIVGGSQASPNEFPWNAFMVMKRADGSEYYCGSTLIYDQWVMTTANCITGSVSADVYLGVIDVTVYEPSRIGFTISASDYFIHPQFDPSTLTNNIALMRLPYSVPYSDAIRAVCLPEANDPDYADDQSTVSGWGKVSDASKCISPVMRKATAQIMTNQECEYNFGSAFVGAGTVCTRYSGSGICGGDSGGPLTIKSADGTWKQIGIASFTSSAGCESGYPNGFTRTSYYSSWIEATCQPVSPTTTRAPTTTTKPTTIAPTTTTLAPTTICPPIYTVTTTTLSTTDSQCFCPELTTVTPAPCVTQAPTLVCGNKPNGYYIDPEGPCTGKFYICSNGNGVVQSCNPGLVYSPTVNGCDYKQNTYPCNQ